jgi:peptidyl-prolyl cis-trans isomerase SurA
MRRLAVLAIAAVALAIPAPSPAQEVLRIVAVVNDDVISALDLTNRVKLALASAGMPDTPESRRQAQNQVLRALIDERLQAQEASRLNVSVSEQDVREAFTRIETNNRMKPGQLEEALRGSGVPRQALEQQIRAGLAWNRLIQRRMRAQIQVGDDEVKEVLDRLKQSEGQPEYLLSEIFLPVDNPDQDEEVRQQAMGLIGQMQRGISFAAIAQQFSQSASAASGGDIGWVQQGQLGDEIDNTLTQIRPGEVTAPLRTVGGYYIYGLRNRRLIAGASPDEATLALAQLLLPIPGRGEAEAQTTMQLAETVREAVVGCDDLGRVARELSAPPPGEAQKLKLRDIAPAIRQRVQGLKVGQAAEPLRSGDAVVVIMLCAREEAQSNLPNSEEISESLIRQRLDLLARRYLRDLRRQAVVDIRA